MALLPLDEYILPMLLEKLCKMTLAVFTKIDHNGIGIMIGKVTELLEHLDHCFPIWGLGLVKFVHPSSFWVFWYTVGCI